MNTRLAKRLKKQFKKDLKAKKAALEKEQKAKRKKGEKAKKADHLESRAPARGVLAKDSRYAYRGPAYVAANEGGEGGDLRGKVYRPVSNRPHLKKIEKIAKSAEFTGGNDKNFNKKAAGQRYPYSWRAHHILPGSAFYYVGSDKQPCFTDDQIQAILRSDYNVNDGHNVIMLPTVNWAVPVHELLQHPSDHVRYTQRVMKDMKEVADSLEKVKDTGKKHDKPEARINAKLLNLENKNWSFLVALGREAISNVVDKTDFVDDDKEFVQLSKKYKFGRLF
jgi:hypothetical protein